MRRYSLMLAVVALLIAATWVFTLVLRRALPGRRTLESALADIGPRVRPPVAAMFERAGCAYPAAEVRLIALKQERVLEVWAADPAGAWRKVGQYAILGASGVAGPKLREGDRQVPEGLYRIDLLNPASSYHLSMRLDYPNELDRAMAAAEGRENLGGDIFIHGSSGSVGCLAMGDAAIEELFLLVHDAGIGNVGVVVAPHDFRRTGRPATLPAGAPAWTGELYRRIEEELASLQPPASRGAED